MNGPAILLVEDSPEDVEFFKRAVRKIGLDCRLSVAVDGQSAVDRLSGMGGGPDAPSHVLLDLKLPLKSGLEVLAWIREHPTLGRIPVIVLTSSEVASDMDQARTLGIDAYLVKPLSTKGLQEIVREIAKRWNIPLAAAPKGAATP